MKTNLSAKCETYNFEELFKRKGYTWFNNKEYNLNIVGIRSNQNRAITNRFDDILIVDYIAYDQRKRLMFNITTEPGTYYIKNLLNVKGTAILVPGQYKDCWQIGYHQGKYKALVQSKPVAVYRDNNKDDVYDLNPETIDKGIFGINIHRSNAKLTSVQVDKWSAGCQVFSNPNDFSTFMRLCEKQANLYGNSFTYTLINEEEM